MVAHFVLRKGCIYNTRFYSALYFKIFVAKDSGHTIVDLTK